MVSLIRENNSTLKGKKPCFKQLESKVLHRQKCTSCHRLISKKPKRFYLSCNNSNVRHWVWPCSVFTTKNWTGQSKTFPHKFMVNTFCLNSNHDASLLLALLNACKHFIPDPSLPTSKKP